MKSVIKKTCAQFVTQGSFVTLMFVALVSLLLWSSLELGRASSWIPQAVLVTTLLLLLLQLCVELINRNRERLQADALEVVTQRNRLAAALLWLGALLLAVWLFGMVVGGSVFCLAYLRWRSGESWRTSAAMALCLGLVLWLFFGIFLRSSLYPGLLLQFLT